ncbi:MAG: hypothetical protein AB1798_10130, partial [Spirochaetota bacterium]
SSGTGHTPVLPSTLFLASSANSTIAQFRYYDYAEKYGKMMQTRSNKIVDVTLWYVKTFMGFSG